MHTRTSVRPEEGVATLTYFAPGHQPAGPGGDATLVAAPPAARRIWPAGTSGIAIPLCYLLAALVLTWRLWVDPASRIVAGNPHDADQFAWFVRYAADAVRHGHLPQLISAGMNAPVGVNLMWNTPVLLCGVVLAPVTLLLGPQVSLTILTTVGFAGSATALFWVLRRWQVSVGAAAVAGAVYGFSPALLQSALSHYDLQFAVLPPLIIHAGLRLALDEPGMAAAPDGRAPSWWQRARPGWLTRIPAPVRHGFMLGLLVGAQIFTGETLALSTAMTGALLVIFLAAARPRVALSRAGPTALGLFVAVVTAVLLTGHALWVQFHGPLTQHGAVYPLDFYVNDLSTFVTPQSSLFFHTAGSAAAAARYQGGATEYLGYLGWPFIALLGAAAVVCWRRRSAWAAALTLLVLGTFSLGGHLLLSGRMHPAIDLPWHWIETLPLFATELPDRLSIPADGVAAALLALGIDEARRRLGARPGALAGQMSAAVLAVAVAGCLPLLPRSLPAERTLPLPAGWSAVFARLQLPAGARVLVVPVPVNYLTPALRWTADTGEPTAMPGGYFIGPGAGGQAYVNGTGIRPTTWYLDELWADGLSPGSPYVATARADYLATATAAGPGKLPKPLGEQQVAADLASWRPAAVVANATLGSPLGRFLTHLFGPPAARSGATLGWRLHG